MIVYKSQVLELLLTRGDRALAEHANAVLPDQVDAAVHGHLLDDLGVDLADLGPARRNTPHEG